MHSTIVSVLASTFIAVTVAKPLIPTPQINAGCTGNILNVFSFASSSCNNTDTTVTPFFYYNKFAAQPGQTTRCTKIQIPGGVVNSFVYASDGIDNGTCTLELYRSDSCTDSPKRDFGLTQDVSGCNSETFRAVKLRCE